MSGSSRRESNGSPLRLPGAESCSMCSTPSSEDRATTSSYASTPSASGGDAGSRPPQWSSASSTRKLGLLTMEWQYVCPGCGEIVERLPSLTSATAHYFCEVCSAERDADLSDFRLTNGPALIVGDTRKSEV